MNILTVGLTVIAVGLSLSGCDSKFVESSPDSVKLTGMSLDERLAQKAEVDERIGQIEQGAEKIKRILDLFRKIQKPDETSDVYTPVDFVIDLNAELKAKIPENQGDRLVRRGTVDIPIESLSPECKTLHTLLESSIIYSDPKNSESKAVGEKLTYSFQSCASGKEYLVALEANWIGSELEFKLNNKNLETIFSDLLIKEALKDSSCSISRGESAIIDAIRCENIDVKLSESERALIYEMEFKNIGDVRFHADADIFENFEKKATSSIRVFADGEVEFNIEKVESGNSAKEQK